MLPTLSTGDLVLHEQLTPLAKLQRGDVIICRSPTDVDTQICKRIVGLPGETVKDAPKSAWGRSEVCHITLNKFTLRQLIYSSLPL
jgi:signal peptidase I